MRNLMKKPVWVGWKYQDGKKRPYSLSGYETGTSPDHSGEWSTFENVREAVDTGRFPGKGFVLPEGYFLLDGDHMLLDHPLIRELMALLNTYMEISPSGNGVHFYGKCDLSRIPKELMDGRWKLASKFYVKNPNNRIEIYIGGLTNRFATYTGNMVSETDEIADCTDALLLILEKYMLRDDSPVELPSMDDDRFIKLTEDDITDILCALRAQNNGDKFRRLYDDGDIAGYGTQSEADAALCAMIAFRAGPNPELIDIIFRDSALYREKWEREDYARRTIMAGIKSCNGVFHRSVKKQPPFVLADKKGSLYVSSTKLAAYVKKHLPYVLVNESTRSDYQIYVYRDGVYKLYSDEMFGGAVKKYIEDYDPDLVRMGAVREAISIICNSEDHIDSEDFNADERYVNLENGLLDLNTMTLLPHTPKVYTTIQLPLKWGVERPTPVFDEYLDTLTGGKADTKRFLLEFLGACLSNVPGYYMKKSLFMYGPGNTGKSQIKRLAELLVGKGNYTGIDLAQMEARFGTGDIYGKRIAGSADMGFMTISELKIFKKATGGDVLFAEFKGENSFRFVYKGLLWFCMNKLPKFGGDDGQWVYDRIIPVYCPNVIEESEQDSKLLDKMYAERDGIFRKAITAFKGVIENGYRFHEPEGAVEIRQEYRVDNNSALEFFETMMQRRAVPMQRNDKVTVTEIYRAYDFWYTRSYGNKYQKTKKEFFEDIADYVGEDYKAMQKKSSFGMCLKDYTLTQEAVDEYGSTSLFGVKIAA